MEIPPNGQKINGLDIIEVFKNYGPESSEMKDISVKYKMQLEDEASKENTSKAGILACVEMLDLYIITGDKSETENSIEDIKNQIDMDGSLKEEEIAELKDKLSAKRKEIAK